MAERTTKGAAGPGKGMSIGSYGEGKLPYPPDKARTKRVQSRTVSEGLRRAAGKRLTNPPRPPRGSRAEDEGSANWTSGKTGGNVTGPLWGMTQSAGDVRKRKGQRAS